MNEPEHNSLVRLAGAVADGERIDWDRELDESPPELRGKIRRLRVAETIRGVYRSLGGAEDPYSAEVEVEPATPLRWGPLRVLERLGGGACGEVFRAHDPTLQREVALKLLHAALAHGDESDERFLEEARRLARIRHPNVLVVHGAARHDGRVGLWTDLLEGKTLEQCLVQQGPFGAREAALVGIDLCRALAAVHAAGLVHRDVKTSNVMRERGGRIVLLDFSSGTDREGRTRTTMLGTPFYMAPELFDGRDSGIAADIYSLGVLLYRLVTGRFPLEARRYSELREAHRSGERTPLRDLRPDLPTAFVQTVERALSPDPRERQAGAGEMEKDLAASLDSSTPADETGGGPFLRRRVVVAALAAASLLAVAIGLWRFIGGPEPFEVNASLFRVGEEIDERLTPGATVAPGDSLFLEITGSKSMHVYVLNQDEAGRAYLLFPLPALDLQNPLRGRVRHQLPGPVGGEPNDWDVDSAGGEERLLVVASRKPLPDLEHQIAELPAAGSTQGVALNDSGLLSTVRGIGGLSPRRDEPTGGDTPLSGISEWLSGEAAAASGIWVWEVRLRGRTPNS